MNGAAIDGEAAASRGHTWVLVDAAPDCGVHLQAVLELLGVARLRKSAKGAVHRVKIQHLAVRQSLRLQCQGSVLRTLTVHDNMLPKHAAGCTTQFGGMSRG